MTDLHHERDYVLHSDATVQGRFLDNSTIEVLREPPGRGGYRHVLFDFDGTLSLIREGWTEIMVGMMVEVLLATPRHESEEALRPRVRDFVLRLTGKQTIYQMIQLAEEVAARGGAAEEPVVYKRAYLGRLMEQIHDRREALRNGKAAPREMLVPGSEELLAALAERGLSLYLASGTDERYVREEADLLGLTPLFGERIYGAVDDYRSFSKAMVIERILRENAIEGAHLLGFGDGYVEIENVKAVGGAAVGVASDEAARSGRPDPWKRERLVGIGADVLVADFREWRKLVAYLFAET